MSRERQKNVNDHWLRAMRHSTREAAMTEIHIFNDECCEYHSMKTCKAKILHGSSGYSTEIWENCNIVFGF